MAARQGTLVLPLLLLAQLGNRVVARQSGYVSDINPDSNDSGNGTDSSYDGGGNGLINGGYSSYDGGFTYVNSAWLGPIASAGGLIAGLLFRRRYLQKKKARELRTRLSEQRKQAKLQQAEANGFPQLPEANANESRVAVAGWVDGTSGNAPVVTVAGTVQYQSISEIDGQAFASPPAYSIATLDTKRPESQVDLSSRGRREGCHSSTTSTLHSSSTATRERSSSSIGRSHHRSGQKKATGKHRSKHDYSSQSEMSDVDRERRRRRREQLYKGATRIRKPNELSPSSPSDR